MDQPSLPTCWVLSDARAGNERQALALAQALQLSVRMVAVDLRAPWSWFAPRLVAGGLRCLPDAQRRELESLPAPQWLIGCGRRTALVNRLLKAHWGAAVRSVQILDPRVDPGHYDALVVPSHDALRGERVVSVCGAVHAVNAGWLAQGRKNWPELGELPGPRTVLLVGGPTGALAMRRRYVDSLIATLQHWHQRDGGSLLISSSRRTPARLRRRLEQAFEALPGHRWWGGEAEHNPYAGYLAWADRIVVTPDSANMLAEAVATPVPVLSHAPRPPGGRVGHLLRELVEAGRVRPLRLSFQPWDCQPILDTPRVAAELHRLLAVCRT